MCIRMQPCEAGPPMEAASGDPWMRMPDADRFRALVPKGLLGLGPMEAGMFSDQSAHGLIHVGFRRFAVMLNCPCGVGYPGVPVATRYDLLTFPSRNRLS